MIATNPSQAPTPALLRTPAIVDTAQPLPLTSPAPEAHFSDELLMEAYVAGDESAFRALFDRHSPGLFRSVRKRLPSDDEARDVVQQAFLNVHRARDAFRQGSKLKPWLHTIALNLVREYYRRAKRRRELSLESVGERLPVVDPRTPFEDLQRADTVRVAMEQLKPAQREVIELRWFQDRSYDEISEIVGASVAAVRVRAHRGYQQLRGELGQLN